MCKTPNLYIRLIAAALLPAIWSATAAAEIIYVDSTAPGVYVDPNAPDPIDPASCRPDFRVLLYPVVSFTTKYTHRGSMNNLLGKATSDRKLVESLSNELQVTKATPPTFLIHCGGDGGVPAENSVLFYIACRKAGVPAELHIYEKGGHGFGLAPNDPILSTWPGRCAAWMKARGLLKK